MRESPCHPRGVRALGVAALAAVALAACDDPGVTAPDARADQFQVVLAPSGDGIVAGRVLVKFRDGRRASGLESIGALAAPVERAALGMEILAVEPGTELATARRLERDPNVEFAEPDYVRTLYAAPNDLYFGYKWGLHNDGSINGSEGQFLANTGAVDADIDWLEAYGELAGFGFHEVGIAILDTGAQLDHEDLATKIVGQHDFFAGDNVAADDNGHGSHTAGIAAAIGNNGKGTTGVAWHGQAQLLIAKVCGPINPGPFGYGCPTSAVASAIEWAADNGARVINLSLGGSSGSSAEQAALQYALSKETLAFCATGNGNGAVSYPAAFPECVAVGATDWSDNRASYSNFGPETELSAPGGDDEHPDGYSYILSAYSGSPTAYAFAAGTSMATPMATGLGGLLASMGVATAEEIRTIMASTADDLGAGGRDVEFGHGRINAYAAVLAAGGGGGGEDPPPEENQPPVAAFTSECADLSCSFDASSSSDPDGDALDYAWDFGDGGSAVGVTADHTYAAAGTYTVTLTVSDGTATTDSQQQVTVAEDPAGVEITLSATGSKVRGQHVIELSWTGATSDNVDIYRNGQRLTTVTNDGSFTDATTNRGSATYTHQVCEADTSTCSNVTTTVF